uniref:Polymerase beta nucleotidyltransferase domain-containing protein n=1 Tax=Ignisphaera aggregans TaxID=334771 RepID=A0A7C5YTS2_9CREN
MNIEYFEVKLNSVVESVKSVLERFDYVEAAVIFGSILRRCVVRDIDIGIVARKMITLRELTEISSKT